MATKVPTLYDRIGGEAGVADMVDAFYIRVLADSELRSYFDGVSVERLRRMQQEFFAAALDGPVHSTPYDLARVHQGMDISRRDITLFVRHLICVLDARELISRADAMEIVFRIATFADEVAGDAGAVDG